MNHFDAGKLAYYVGKFGVYKRSFSGAAVVSLENPTLKNFVAHLDGASKVARKSGLGDASRRLADIAHQVRRADGANVSQALGVEARNARDVLVSEMKKRKFLRVATGLTKYLDKDDLFGAAVSANFASARRDIQEAGNCLAAECGTACVFHLMRAAECGLRALARDRRVEFADKPLEHKEWGQILPNLEAKLKSWKDGSTKADKWPSQFVKENQTKFYHEVVQELRSFNEMWRRHVSHADTAAFYDSKSAEGVMEHVRVFMQKLATKISEHSVTDEFWQT
ncbi:MAG: hypothetical protein AB7N65_06840 [Vicinamibacterales bacterium]